MVPRIRQPLCLCAASCESMAVQSDASAAHRPATWSVCRSCASGRWHSDSIMSIQPCAAVSRFSRRSKLWLLCREKANSLRVSWSFADDGNWSDYRLYPHCCERQRTRSTLRNELLERLNLSGMCFSFDALHTQNNGRADCGEWQ